eukprot:scaffold1278_cov356-Prasinococcus_capsulatus_cf.AAC.5
MRACRPGTARERGARKRSKAGETVYVFARMTILSVSHFGRPLAGPCASTSTPATGRARRRKAVLTR